MARLTHNEKLALATIALHPNSGDFTKVRTHQGDLHLSDRSMKIMEAILALSTAKKGKKVEGFDKKTLKVARKVTAWAAKLPV